MKRLLLLALSLLLIGCGPESRSRVYDPAQVNFQASYNSLFDGILYPSVMLAMANYTGTQEEMLFSVSVTAPTSNAVLRVVVDSTALNYVTILQEVMPKRGERYTFTPKVKWKYDALYRQRQQRPLDLAFTCYVNDEEVDVENLRLNCRSVSDCPLCLRDTNGRNHDFRWLFMGYVNEEHPIIDSILNTMLEQDIVSGFTGYQKGSAQVVKQVEAIWYYALDRGITYSSISCTANPSKRAMTQHIRFFDEVYNSRQANCIDACVFFASIMRKIGLKPVILVEPCHAYLGYYADSKKRDLRLLETTITAWVNFPAMTKSFNETGSLTADQESKARKYLSPENYERWKRKEMGIDDLKHLIADTLFARASRYQTESYQANKKLFSDTTQTGYQMLPVDELRKVVQPIS